MKFTLTIKQIKTFLDSISYFLVVLSSIILSLYTGNAVAGVITLAWNPSSSPNVSDYRLFYGQASRNYKYNIDVGYYTACTVVVPEGATYYFAIKAYDSAGNESGFSNEVSKPFIKGDLNGDGRADLVGVASNGAIWYTTNRSTWRTVPGTLARIATGDLNGDGRADLVGLTSTGAIYYSTDLSAWRTVPGTLAQIATGDLNGDGRADPVGVASNGTIWYTSNLSTWSNIPGYLSQLAGN